MQTLGIDPGLTGGISAIDQYGQVLFCEAMPISRGQVDTVDVKELRRLLDGRSIDISIYAYVERAQVMPAQGISSGFAYGVNFGTLLGALAAFGIGYQLVPASVWKRKLGLMAGSDKAASIGLARQHYPKLTFKKGEHGLAESLLIARWGWEKDRAK
jgi:tetrahydromethanopterin S-methyltransferase subunit B